MKLTYLASTVMAIAVSITVVAGKTPQTTSPDRTGVATAPRQAAGTTDSRTFINHLVIAGMAEVELGKLASERAADADVKAFGQMMVTDHTKAGDELLQVASRVGVQPPKQLDTKHQELRDRLAKLRGAEFDREYISAMVMGHEEVVAKLRAQARSADQSTSAQPSNQGGATAGTSGGARTETGSAGTSTGSKSSSAGATAVGAAGSNAGNDAVAQWAAKALPTVEHHLERARALQQRVK